jgi:hypothetical protein
LRPYPEKKTLHNKRAVEWLKVKALSSSPSTTKKKKKKVSEIFSYDHQPVMSLPEK